MSIVERAIKRLSNNADGKGRRVPPKSPKDSAANKQIQRAVGHQPVLTGLAHLPDSEEVEVNETDVRASGLLLVGGDDSRIDDEFRRIKRPLLQNTADTATTTNGGIICLASALPGAGKSFCALNLAYMMAPERDQSVLLVDADTANPKLSRTLGLENSRGLTDYLLEKDVSLADLIVSTNLAGGMYFLPAGQRHREATELLASARAAELIAEIEAIFEGGIVVIDSPPLLITSEAQVIADRAGQVLFIVESGESSQDSVERALEMLNHDKPINLVLNKTSTRSKDDYQGYNYGSYA